ncbi:hypothetical protein HDV03_004883 [Kappamyces sp. JEL0829]|nr:hypothetical protein HDV03_004883 [Kappamyces sp. JEL0829]
MKFRWKGLLKSLQYFSIVIQLTSVIAVLMLCWADVDTPLYRITTLLRGVPIMSTYALIPFIIYLDFKLLELAALFDERIGNQTKLRNIILAVYCSTTVLPLVWQILDVAAPQWLDYAHLYSLAVGFVVYITTDVCIAALISYFLFRWKKSRSDTLKSNDIDRRYHRTMKIILVGATIDMASTGIYWFNHTFAQKNSASYFVTANYVMALAGLHLSLLPLTIQNYTTLAFSKELVPPNPKPEIPSVTQLLMNRMPSELESNSDTLRSPAPSLQSFQHRSFRSWLSPNPVLGDSQPNSRQSITNDGSFRAMGLSIGMDSVQDRQSPPSPSLSFSMPRMELDPLQSVSVEPSVDVFGFSKSDSFQADDQKSWL